MVAHLSLGFPVSVTCWVKDSVAKIILNLAFKPAMVASWRIVESSFTVDKSNFFVYIYIRFIWCRGFHRRSSLWGFIYRERLIFSFCLLKIHIEYNGVHFFRSSNKFD